MNMGVENKFSTSINALGSDVQVPVGQFAVNDLVCFERIQKLDLLLHLIVNLQNTLVLRGMAGVGKTTLLTAAVAQDVKFGDILLFKASEDVSFELLQNKLLAFITRSNTADCPTLAEALERYAQKSRYLVLMIDDAVLLVPGLIKSLIEFAERYQALRLVFSFTPEEYLLTSQVESLDGRCHFIELPELNLHQCKLFIQQIVDLEKTIYVQSDISTAFTHDIYIATKGVPGAIVQMIVNAQKKPLSNLSLLVMLSALVVIASVFVSEYLWVTPEVERVKDVTIESSPPRKPKLEVLTTENEAVVTSNVSLEQLNDSVMKVKKVVEGSGGVQGQRIVSKQSNAEQLEVALDKVSVDPVAQVVNVKNDIKKRNSQGLLATTKIAVLSSHDNDVQWVLAQSSRQYTLQLMALSDKKKLLAEKDRYFKLGYKTFFIERKSKKVNNYVLLYGRFPSIGAAKNAMRQLPKELRQSWPRRFSALQKIL